MAVKDITSLRPAYLSWTLFRDYHYAVFNKDGEMVLILVTTKGKKLSYFVPYHELVTGLHSIVYENHLIEAQYNLGIYSRECTDLQDTLRKHDNPTGEYSMSVVDASGERLYSFNVYI